VDDLLRNDWSIWPGICKEGEIIKLKTKSDKILDAIDEERIGRANLNQLTVGYAILFDKRRLISDQSTVSVASHHKYIIDEITRKNWGKAITKNEVEEEAKDFE